jgi:hypothetical protein
MSAAYLSRLAIDEERSQGSCERLDISVEKAVKYVIESSMMLATIMRQ